MKTEKAMFLGVTLLLMVSLTLPLGCAKEVETPTQFKTFSKYGFSFEYPINFKVNERGLIDNEANDNSGVVEVVYENENVQAFQITYIKILQWSNLDAVSGLEAWIKKENVTSMEIGELTSGTKDGHPMLYQYAAATNYKGEEICAIMASFYCDKSEKGVLLMILENTISPEEDILQDFQRYLDSFICH